MRKFNITVNGKTYEVEVEEVDTPISSESKVAPKPSSSTTASEQKEASKSVPVKVSAGQEVVEAPMPGNIWKVLVKEGQEIKEGSILLILESMKMENEILSPKDGVVSRIATSEGAAVNTGDQLVILD